jgi:histidine triad (HIT) family protein
VVCFISPHWWPNNPGHVLVVPRQHFENLYELPTELGTAVFEASKQIALAMKRGYGCAGISTRQHNEPAGNQDLWHYHLHVFPRYEGDRLYQSHGQGRLVPAAERALYARKVREALGEG